VEQCNTSEAAILSFSHKVPYTFCFTEVITVFKSFTIVTYPEPLEPSAHRPDLSLECTF